MKIDTTNVFFSNIICLALIYIYVSHLNVKTYLIDCLDLRIGIGRLRSTQVVLTSL